MTGGGGHRSLPSAVHYGRFHNLFEVFEAGSGVNALAFGGKNFCDGRLLDHLAGGASLQRGHNGAAHADPLDGPLDQSLGLRVLNELARVYEPEISSLRHHHCVRIDAGPTVENPRTRQLFRRLEQTWLDAEDRVCRPRLQHLQCTGEARCSDHHGIL